MLAHTLTSGYISILEIDLIGLADIKTSGKEVYCRMIGFHIDLNTAQFDLQIKRDGKGIPLPVFDQSIENINIKGFIPVIINIQPVINLPLLLGVNGDADETPLQVSLNDNSSFKTRFEYAVDDQCVCV